MESLGASSMSPVAALFAAFALLVALVVVVKPRYGKSKLPPGPKPLPLIGNIHQIGDLPHHKLAHMAKTYGPIMHMKMGSVPMVVVSTAAAAEEFLRVQDKPWASRPQHIADQIFSNNFRDIVMSPLGSHWRHMRKICTLELFTPKRMESFRTWRTEEFDLMVQSVYDDSVAGRPAVLTVKLGHLASNIITRMLLGKKFFQNDGAGAAEAAQFKDLVFTLFSISNTPTVGDYIPWLKWVTYASGHVRYVKKVKVTADRYLQEFLDVKKNGAATDDATRKEDLVDVLLAQPSESGEGTLDDDAIRAVLMDLLLAGTDNSSNTVEWAISELLLNPKVRRKLQDELDTVVGLDRVVTEQDIPNLPYLRAVVKETFRLHPTTPLNIPHESTEATTVWGYDFPAGTALLVNFYAIHRDPGVWERPLEFDPERFLKRPDIDVTGTHFGLIPFGSGRRQCPGMQLGVLFVHMSVARLVQAFEMGLPNGADNKDLDMNELFCGTTLRKVPLAVSAKPRMAAKFF